MFDDILESLKIDFSGIKDTLTPSQPRKKRFSDFLDDPTVSDMTAPTDTLPSQLEQQSEREDSTTMPSNPSSEATPILTVSLPEQHVEENEHELITPHSPMPASLHSLKKESSDDIMDFLGEIETRAEHPPILESVVQATKRQRCFPALDDELQEIKELITDDVNNFNSVHESLKSRLLEHLITCIQSNPTKTDINDDVFFYALRNEASLIQTRTHLNTNFYIRAFETNNEIIKHLPDSMITHEYLENIQPYLASQDANEINLFYWTKRLELESTALQHAPEWVKKDRELVKLALKEPNTYQWVDKTLKTDHNFVFQITQAIPDLYQQTKNILIPHVLQKLKDSAINLESLKQIIKIEDSDFLNAILVDELLSKNTTITTILYTVQKNNFIKALEEGRIEFSALSEALQQQDALIIAAIKSGLSLKDAPKQNIAIICAALQRDPTEVQFVDQFILENKPYLNAAIKEDVLYATLPEHLKQQVREIALNHLQSTPHENIQDKYFTLAPTLQQDGQFFLSFLKHILTLNLRGNLKNPYSEIIKSTTINYSNQENKHEVFRHLSLLFTTKYFHLSIFNQHRLHCSIEDFRPFINYMDTSNDDMSSYFFIHLLKYLFPTEYPQLYCDALHKNMVFYKLIIPVLRVNPTVLFTALKIDEKETKINIQTNPNILKLIEKLIALKNIATTSDLKNKTDSFILKIQRYLEENYKISDEPETSKNQIEECCKELLVIFENTLPLEECPLQKTIKDIEINILNLNYKFELLLLKKKSSNLSSPLQNALMELSTQINDQFVESSAKPNGSQQLEQLIRVLNHTNQFLENKLTPQNYQKMAEAILNEKSLGMKALGTAMITLSALITLSGIAIATTGVGLVIGSTIATLGVSSTTLSMGFFNNKTAHRPLKDKIKALNTVHTSHQEAEHIGSEIVSIDSIEDNSSERSEEAAAVI